MGTDDPSSLGLAEKKQKSGKPACRVFFVLPHSRRECSRAHSLFIRVHLGNPWLFKTFSVSLWLGERRFEVSGFSRF
jgi:hypothetical protein